MNVRADIPHREPVRLTVDAFVALRRSGAFDRYEKAELLDGELWGVPRADDEAEASDAEFPIKLTVASFMFLADAGLFDHLGKTELVDGLVYEMSPQYRPHGFVKDELAYRLRRALETRHPTWHVATEQSVDIPPHSEPQPDIVVTSEPCGAGAIPVGSLSLVVEIAANTLRFDRGQKMRLYAMAGVAEYWVVDIVGGVIHQMWRPVENAYAERREVAFGTSVTAATIVDLEVRTDGLREQ